MVIIADKTLLTLELCTLCLAPTGFDWFGKPVLCLTCETIEHPAKNNESEKAVSIVTPLERSTHRPQLSLFTVPK